MKKSIIAAGAASIALAAMPVVSTFALASEEEVTDNLTVNLSSTCTLTRSGVAGTGVDPNSQDDDASWTNATGSDAGTYTVTMDAGTVADLGTSTFSITCNDTTAGHYLSVETTGLDRQGSDPLETLSYTNSTVNGTTNPGWNIIVAQVTGSGVAQMPAWNENVVSNLGIIQISNGTADLYGADDDTNTNVLQNAQFTANYKVGTAATTKAGTYTGSATYTLTHGE